MSTPDAETQRLRAEIEHTREQLGETVQELAYRADVPARTREKLHETRQRGQQVVASAVSAGTRPVPLAASAVAALLILALWLWRRRR